ncbi:AfsR/SARP family transcriptional regulator [Cellulomonas dongxiuzhuiae]|uniref:AfsR/SARP family transcriptional regulator n=1 Tax=Cellulomonas dongxiuzhuiae TaxID=2819979 RepID=UPI001AAE934A|nr:BTAD domain-containing putative transcriptional regulator [Cellulomonas dongxiuzhuiae]MBO3089349.1 tetratricopeptide repeat protein [Cellulomonas dongxiuzhuiae]
MPPASTSLRLRLLGAPHALVDDRPVDLGAPKQCAVLVGLALRAGRAVGHDALVDGTWGEGAPASARGSVHTYVSGLRRVLGPDVLRRTPTGYVLAVPADAVDALDVERRARSARDAREASDLRGALVGIDSALGLWPSGDVLAGVPGPFAAEQRTHLAQLRVRLLVERTELLVASGAGPAVLADAADRLMFEVATYPYDERLRCALMSALAGSGRTAAALEQYDDLRRQLAEGLGIDPGAAARAAHARILVVPGARHPALRRPPTSDRPAGLEDLPLPAAQPPADPRVAPAQLPPDLAAFVGRSRELVEVLRAAAGPDGPRVVSVVGVGGVGKTTLAVRTGHMLRDRFTDGQLYVNLRGFDPRHPPVTPSTALRQLLAALGVLSAPQQHDQLVALWRSMVADRRLLVVLDNAASTEQVEDLLPGSPSCFVLVTSRDRLGGLAVRHGARSVPLARFEPAEARELLEGTIGADVVAREPDATRRLVELCDALPFALRIAAEQVHTGPGASIGEMVARLVDSRHRLDVLDLDDGPSASVRGVLATSTAALDAEQRRALCLLAVLPCQSTSVLATAALVDVAPARAAQLLDQLHDHHLLEAVDGRYAMHDLTRAHAAELAERLGEDERAAARERLLAWYVCTLVASTHHRRLQFDPPPPRHELPLLADAAALLRWTLAELANMTALVRDGHAHGHHRPVWQMVALLFETYYAAAGATEWLDSLRVASRSARALGDTRAQAVLLNHESVACSRLGRNDASVQRLREALRLLDGDRWWYRVSVVSNLASTLREAAQYDAALVAAHDAHAAARDLGDGYYQVAAGDVLCELYAELGDWDAAVRHGEPALAIARVEGHRVLEANLLVNLGLAADGLGDHDAAQRRFAHVLHLCADMGDLYHEALALFGLARVRAARDGPAGEQEARRDAERALDRFRQLGAEEAGAVQEFLARMTVDAALR